MDTQRFPVSQTIGTPSWTRNSDVAGASIQPCPWIQEKPTGNDMPYYLWDRTLKQTIAVSELADSPKYITISHTWGRWKTKDEPVHLRGTPWSIPPNSIFEVGRLPAILDQIPLPHRFIWIDLLCIPQDGSTLAKIEISRQATIFREASIAIMWLNDIGPWTTLQFAVEWLSVQFIQDNHLYTEMSDVMAKQVEQNRKLMNSMELIKPRQATDSKMRTDTFHPWFTSLWTLQEICLRPDMLIANKNWEFVALNDCAIAFDEIVALEYASRKANNDTPPPTAVIQLKSLLTYTGLSQLASMTRCSILGLGSHRHCLGRRAEAIMAVLDATEWFTSATDDQEREKNLVLSLYPLKFVQEVQKNVGPATFFFSDSVQSYFAEALTHPGTNPKEAKPMGSLLPFGLGLPKHYQEIIWDHEWKVHDSVHSWTIEGTAGCVRISDAAVVSSSERQYDEAMRSTIMAPVVGEVTGRQVGVQHVNLHEWMKSFDTKFANYAVCLFTSPLGSMGVLLKQIEPGVMIKVGTYFQDPCPQCKAPDAEKLNWLVL
ncbi:hypothetical protein EDB80DRAFT_572561 [Ilyonectria destructans]|nr:hypothetical protein EDB80DRAFT_572561 [Ilyonectria destructans]